MLRLSRLPLYQSSGRVLGRSTWLLANWTDSPQTSSSLQLLQGEHTLSIKPSESAEMKPKSSSNSRVEGKAAVKRKLEKQAKATAGAKRLKTETGAQAARSRTERAAGWLAEAVVRSRSQAERSVEGFQFNEKRVRVLSGTSAVKAGSEGVIYWMSRDQRVQDNWALLYAQQLALAERLPLHVCFCLVPRFLDATIRQFDFLLRGLEEVAKECSALGLEFHLLQGCAGERLPRFVQELGVGAVVTDFSPLRVPLQWVEEVKKALPRDIPLIQVDAHNVVPCWVASNKQEYSAKTIRNKINSKLPEFLKEFPLMAKHPHCASKPAEPVDWERARSSLEVDQSVKAVSWARPGSVAGLAVLESFIDQRLQYFDSLRNNPNSDALSNLSPWLHFGHVSAQRVVLEVERSGQRWPSSVKAFVEETVVRRELADNFCFYNKNYDCVEGAYEWAQKTLRDHAEDPRPYLYTRDELEAAKTHDKLWNAAQFQMVSEGKMHGFLRMYWAKKILEWTSSPHEALAIAIYLNDRYELDGRDPSGYVGQCGDCRRRAAKL
ncbi:CPD photolyase isoform X2 [Amia ocellicauda]|uniref:CPD photolyase isoform X2 n=1 Tax=Amia ocellicauda TaxID=2972642 RepID=UPI00346424E8